MPPHAVEPPFPTTPSVPAILEKRLIIHQTKDVPSRPSTPRRATEPSSLTSTPQLKVSTLPIRSRTRSPYSRSHLRTRSSTSSLQAPPMTRAHSSPLADTSGPVLTSTVPRPTSPLGPPSRRRSPLLRPTEETYSSFTGQLDISETISENSELQFTPRAWTDTDAVPSSPSSIHHTFPRTRRRPSSPLHTMLQSPAQAGNKALRTSISSPSLAAVAKYNESYPSNLSFSSSSMPSTPTSLRSRSPSISSLETIPDSPYAEAAEEAEQLSRLEAAAEKDSDGDGTRRRSSLDVPGRNNSGVVLGTNSFGVVYGARDKRKRWSVCGAERRGDLDLETIWED
ncbi:hypothetical protein MMC06_005081 [Schaereria dolodes]|nr:hypothetical protein [Schaereria dolodes]